MKPIVGIAVATGMLVVCGLTKADTLDAPGDALAAPVYYTSTNAPGKTSKIVLLHAMVRIDQSDKPALDGSPDAIHLGFAQIIEQNFARVSPAQALATAQGLSDQEVGDIVAHYKRSIQDSGHKPQLLRVLAERLDATQLARFQVAFDTGAELPRPPAPGYWLEYTPEEIYLDLRTASVGALGPAAAILEAGSYIGMQLYMSYWAGYQAGTLLNGLMEKYTPGLYNDIGRYLDNSVNYITAAGSNRITIGQDQQNFGKTFTWSPYGPPVYAVDGSAEQYGGDYGVDGGWSYDYDTNFGGGGGSCWPYPYRR